MLHRPVARIAAIVVFTATLIPVIALAQAIPAGPVPGTVMTPEYARVVAKQAYVWGWPMVNQMNRKAAITQAPEPGRLNGVLPVAPRGQIAMLSDCLVRKKDGEPGIKTLWLGMQRLRATYDAK